MFPKKTLFKPVPPKSQYVVHTEQPVETLTSDEVRTMVCVPTEIDLCDPRYAEEVLPSPEECDLEIMRANGITPTQLNCSQLLTITDRAQILQSVENFNIPEPTQTPE